MMDTLGTGLTAVIPLNREIDAEDDLAMRITKLISFARAYRGIQSARHTTELTHKNEAYAYVIMRGTEKAIRDMQQVINISGLETGDANYTHDHDACIQFAKSQGVPPNWAHRVETYLSM